MLIFIIGAALRVYELTGQSMWADETFIANSLKLNTSEMIHFLWFNENHPPFYLFVMKGWSFVFGISDGSLRAFSVIIGVVSIFLLYMLVKLLWDEKIALISAAFLAISPFAIYYSQEARHYGLWFALSCLSFYYFFQTFFFGKKCYLRWAFVTAFCLYTHVYSIFIPFIQGATFLWALIQRDEERRNVARSSLYNTRFWTAIFILILLSLPMGWWIFLRISHDTVGFGKTFSFYHLIYTPFVWTYGYSFGPSINELHIISAKEVVANYWIVVIPALLLLSLVALAGIIKELREGKLQFFWMMVFLSLILIIASPLYTYVYYNVRATLFLVPFFYALIGIGSSELMRIRKLLIFIPLVMASLMLFSSEQYFHNPVYFRDDVRSVARILAATSSNIPILTGRMLEERDISHYYDTSKQTFLRFEFVTPAELGQYDELWVVKNRMWLYENEKTLQEFLITHYNIEKEYHFPGATLELLQKKQFE